MRILFTGGGSGGHIFPIIAVKREIDNLVPEEIKS
jgi:UDP-N-acetylglucosamine:LPS N-acetylglucosamine transferase